MKPIKNFDTELIAVFKHQLKDEHLMNTKIILVQHKKGKHILIKQWFDTKNGSEYDNVLPPSVVCVQIEQIEMYVDAFLSMADYIDTL
jgi:hypothetical protein